MSGGGGGSLRGMLTAVGGGGGRSSKGAVSSGDLSNSAMGAISGSGDTELGRESILSLRYVTGHLESLRVRARSLAVAQRYARGGGATATDEARSLGYRQPITAQHSILLPPPTNSTPGKHNSRLEGFI